LFQNNSSITFVCIAASIDYFALGVFVSLSIVFQYFSTLKLNKMLHINNFSYNVLWKFDTFEFTAWLQRLICYRNLFVMGCFASSHLSSKPDNSPSLAFATSKHFNVLFRIQRWECVPIWNAVPVLE